MTEQEIILECQKEIVNKLQSNKDLIINLFGFVGQDIEQSEYDELSNLITTKYLNSNNWKDSRVFIGEEDTSLVDFQDDYDALEFTPDSGDDSDSINQQVTCSVKWDFVNNKIINITFEG